MKNVFIDGSSGTTGLRIADRLAGREDIHLLKLPEEERKNPEARRRVMNQCDIVFLCLPDDAAREAVTLCENPETAIIDTSTAHRTAPGWVYGFPEIGNLRKKIPASHRIANPGCHASGFIALAAPLQAAGILKKETVLTAFSLTGYSGGGKKMIAQYEAPGRDPLLEAPRSYGLTQNHKHLPEMAKIAGLDKSPLFTPIVAPYYAGMEVVLSLSQEFFTSSVTPRQLSEIYRSYYNGKGLVTFRDNADEGGFLSAGAFAGRDDMEITVTGNEERMLAVARFDNLGKGASGAAIQNMNLLLGLPENTGLVVGE